MGILLGWIVQKRWLTLAAFLLNVAAVFVVPRLPVPFSYLWFVAPILLVVALFYEVGRAIGLKLSQRMRLIFALWMGFSTLVLMLGIAFSGSNPMVLIVSIAVFSVLAMSGTLTVGVAFGRQSRREHSQSMGGVGGPAS